MEYSVFVDGAEGTAGLGIHERFKKRNDIEIINIHESQKKDIGERVKRI
ncbi:MAG: N-acetyl-gamma-glutamyl-phosphate reductase, partial [Clostridiales bacterium]|nr:N-acetyl-gamma-glutamyl-phosphate reductase [Clostridiales bacterium]